MTPSGSKPFKITSKAAIACVAGLLAVTALALLAWPQADRAPAPFPAPEVIAIPAGTISYRPFGSFEKAGKAQTPATVPTQVNGVAIMKYQVSRAQYGACVAAGACDPGPSSGADLPQTHVNWTDAHAFADWYSALTGEAWRLPTDREWQLAAAERYGDAVADPGDLDPGERMLANYKAGVLLRGTASPTLRPSGGFGVNSRGVADMAGNVWEWTDGCMESGTLNPDGTIARSEPYCWVRIAGGRHRAAIVDFIRDASVGGCAVGMPPDHLGFRLVRDTAGTRRRWLAFL